MRADKVFRVLSFMSGDGKEIVGQAARGSLLVQEGEKRVVFVRDHDGTAIAFTYDSYGVVPTVGVPQRGMVVFHCPSGKVRTFTAYKELAGGEVDVRTVVEVEVHTGASRALQLGEGVNDRDVRRRRRP